MHKSCRYKMLNNLVLFFQSLGMIISAILKTHNRFAHEDIKPSDAGYFIVRKYRLQPKPCP